jgi:hypothetical protein
LDTRLPYGLQASLAAAGAPDAIKCRFRPEIEVDGDVAAGRRMAGCRGLDGRSRLPLRFARGDVFTVVAVAPPPLNHVIPGFP